jgi:predicted secreted hydrolase
VRRRAVLLAGPLAALGRTADGGAATPAPESATRYAAVRPDRPLVFPRDHGAHPDFRTEWWYVTGWLTRAGAAPCGFQVTFFRSRTAHADANPSRFAPTQLLFAHAALALPERGRLWHDERAARAGPGGVRFSVADTDLAIGDWSFARDAASGRYAARAPGADLDRALFFAPAGAPLPQGEGGYSRKGPRPEQASHYYSLPQMTVTGRIAAGAGRERKSWDVQGRAWLDHEWSSTLLDEHAAGWDWIGINFDDGGSLMAFRIRSRDGTTLWSHAARRDARGVPVASGELRWAIRRMWASPQSQARYPIAFDLSLATEAWALEPLMDDQEIDARRSTGGYYWEGAVQLSAAGRRVGRGYLELTGYAAPLRL